MAAATVAAAATAAATLGHRRRGHQGRQARALNKQTPKSFSLEDIVVLLLLDNRFRSAPPGYRGVLVVGKTPGRR